MAPNYGLRGAGRALWLLTMATYYGYLLWLLTTAYVELEEHALLGGVEDIDGPLEKYSHSKWPWLVANVSGQR